MTDPFQDVDSIGPEFVSVIAKALESRASEAQMLPIVARYLSQLDWQDDTIHLEVGTGTGPIARQMAMRSKSQVVGIDPSKGLIERAVQLSEDIANLEFQVGAGDAINFATSTFDSVVMHTVLSHVPSPETLLSEAHRVLKSGGKLVVCDADFEKSHLGNYEGDPLEACAKYFVANFVTHPYLISIIRELAISAGFSIESFTVNSRSITDTDGGLGWINIGTTQMLERGLISEQLAASLSNEYLERKSNGRLYGHQPFGTLIATKR